MSVEYELYERERNEGGNVDPTHHAFMRVWNVDHSEGKHSVIARHPLAAIDALRQLGIIKHSAEIENVTRIEGDVIFYDHYSPEQKGQAGDEV